MVLPSLRFLQAALPLCLCALVACSDSAVPLPGPCETLQLQCTEGMCEDLFWTMGRNPPTCIDPDRNFSDLGVALPPQLESLEPGTREAALPAGSRDGGPSTFHYLSLQTSQYGWYRFELECDPGVHCLAQRLDATGRELPDSAFSTPQLSYVSKPSAPERSVFALAVQGAAGLHYRYSLEFVPDDRRDGLVGAEELSGWSTQWESVLEVLEDDVDAVTVRLTEGQPFHVACDDATTGGRRYSEDLSVDAISLSFHESTYRARRTGLTLLQLRNSSRPVPAASRRYRCTFRDLTVDDFDAEQVGTLGPTGIGTGWFERAGDVDAWSATAVEGRDYAMYCTYGCAVRVLAPDGTVVGSVPSSSSYAPWKFRAGSSGTYRFEVTAREGTMDVPGSYALSFADAG